MHALGSIFTISIQNGWLGKRRMPHIRLATVGTLLALALAVEALRLHRLSEIPPGLFFDEGAHGVDAIRVLQGDHAVFFPENRGREGLIVYAVAIAISLMGRTVMAIRLPAALASAGTVFALFWLGQLLFGRDEESGQATPWRGLLIGGAGAALLAVSLGHTILGRTAFRINFLPLLLSLCLALMWLGWSQRSWWRVLLAGACAGLLQYTYMPARITPFFLLVFGLSLLAPFCSGFNDRLRTELPWAGLFAGAAALVAAPMFVHFALHPDHLFLRSSQLWIFDPGLNLGNSLGKFLENVWVYLSSFIVRGDLNWRHNLPGQPLLNRWEALLFLLGIVAAIWRWQRPAYRLLLLWLVFLVLPATLALEGAPTPNTVRIFGAMPAIYLLAAVGMWEAFHVLRVRLRTLSICAAPSFLENGTKSAIVLGVIVGGLILGKGAHTYRAYFDKWAGAPELYWAYHTEWTELARTLNDRPTETDLAYLLLNGLHHVHYSFDYLYQGLAPAHMIYTAIPSLAQKIQAALTPMEYPSTVQVVEWKTHTPWAGSGDEDVVHLMSKYGRFLGSDEHDAFQVHSFTDIDLDRRWIFYEDLVPRPIVYDGGIMLQGFALGRGERQLPAEDIVNLGTERSLWAALQLKTAPGLNIDYVISLRLYDGQGERNYQKDALLVDYRLAHTSLWTADEPIDNLFHFDFPADLPPGEYELRLVIYDSQTLKPTAQLDVWNTEIGLVRLHLAEAR